jgi:NAD(P)-dependent dehydrogenase (short-subunit alcohol dehydrogenase family)
MTVMEMATLRNKTALVTGASRGIGRATAAALAEAGAHLLVHYGRSSQEAESLVESIRAKGGRAEAIRADLATTDGATSLAKEVRSIGGERLDVLVCNAGVNERAKPVFSDTAGPAHPRTRLEHCFDLVSRGSNRSGHTRS